MDKGNLSITYQDKTLDASEKALQTPLQSLAKVFIISKRLKGAPVSPGVGIGRAKVVSNAEDLDNVDKGDVVVCREASRKLMIVVPKLKALIAESGGMLAFGFRAAIASGIPAVSGPKGILDSVQTGDIVRVDGFTGDIQILNKGE